MSRLVSAPAPKPEVYHPCSGRFHVNPTTRMGIFVFNASSEFLNNTHNTSLHINNIRSLLNTASFLQNLTAKPKVVF
jgi:hypothetical protein